MKTTIASNVKFKINQIKSWDFVIISFSRSGKARNLFVDHGKPWEMMFVEKIPKKAFFSKGIKKQEK